MNGARLRYAIAAILVCATALVAAQETRTERITYTPDGRIPVPDYSKWIFIGSGAFDSADTAPAPRFSNVFVAPAVYDEYVRTGLWPDQTVIFSEKRAGITTLPITSNPGWGQTGAPLGFEFEVKDVSRGGWKYYTAKAGETAGTRVAKQSDCTTCHQQRGAVDSTFVQFYPTLVDPAKRHGTFRLPTQ